METAPFTHQSILREMGLVSLVARRLSGDVSLQLLTYPAIKTNQNSNPMSENYPNISWTLMDWGCDQCPGQPVPVSDHPLVQNLSLTPAWSSPQPVLFPSALLLPLESRTQCYAPLEELQLLWGLPSVFSALHRTNTGASAALTHLVLLTLQHPHLDIF